MTLCPNPEVKFIRNWLHILLIKSGEATRTRSSCDLASTHKDIRTEWGQNSNARFYMIKKKQSLSEIHRKSIT